jgi:hypothetical protein
VHELRAVERDGRVCELPGVRVAKCCAGLSPAPAMKPSTDTETTAMTFLPFGLCPGSSGMCPARRTA